MHKTGTSLRFLRLAMLFQTSGRALAQNFVLSASPATGPFPACVVAADVNGDGKVDLVAANNGDDTLTVLLNSPAPPSLNLQPASANALLLSWSAAWPGFTLQQNFDLTATNWLDVNTNAVTYVNGINQVTLPAPTPERSTGSNCNRQSWVTAMSIRHGRGAANNPACRAESRNAGEGGHHANLWAFRAESAHEIDDKAYRQNQAKPAPADDGTAKVKPTAAEQEKENKHE